ncbi:MAG: hypothetical protein RIT04_82, partial [Candidatus Parcubacteria bacterium]
IQTLPDTDLVTEEPKENNSKTYSGPFISFTYPPLLTLNQTGETATLKHSVPYTHQNPCDFKGDAPPLTEITDFSVSFKVVDKSPKEYVQSSGWPDWEYVSKNPLQENWGPFGGYKIGAGVEGCGQDIYYLIISPNKTLVIRQDYVTEFNPREPDYKKSLQTPGIITPSQSELIFKQIISSITTQITAQIRSNTLSEPAVIKSLIENWKKIAPAIIPQYPQSNVAFYGYPSTILFIANNRIIITYENSNNEYQAVLEYKGGSDFTYLTGQLIGSGPSDIQKLIAMYGSTTATYDRYTFTSNRQGEIVYPSDWVME